MPDKCRFWSFCLKVYRYECGENPSVVTCDNYWFAELVHNHAIEETREEMKNWGVANVVVDDVKSLKIPQHSEEGE